MDPAISETNNTGSRSGSVSSGASISETWAETEVLKHDWVETGMYSGSGLRMAETRECQSRWLMVIVGPFSFDIYCCIFYLFIYLLAWCVCKMTSLVKDKCEMNSVFHGS